MLFFIEKSCMFVYYPSGAQDNQDHLGLLFLNLQGQEEIQVNRYNFAPKLNLEGFVRSWPYPSLVYPK